MGPKGKTTTRRRALSRPKAPKGRGGGTRRYGRGNKQIARRAVLRFSPMRPVATGRNATFVANLERTRHLYRLPEGPTDVYNHIVIHNQDTDKPVFEIDKTVENENVLNRLKNRTPDTYTWWGYWDEWVPPGNDGNPVGIRKMYASVPSEYLDLLDKQHHPLNSGNILDVNTLSLSARPTLGAPTRGKRRHRSPTRTPTRRRTRRR